MITGRMANVDAINVLLHRHDVIAIWDYNYAGSLVKIDMNPPFSKLASKDAIYFSVLKFLGGLQTGV